MEERTIGNDDAPIVLTRSDPNFEAREKLAEKLWERERQDWAGEEEDQQTDKPEEGIPDDDQKQQDEKEVEADQEEVEAGSGDTAEADSEDAGEAEEAAQADTGDDDLDTLIVDGQTIHKPRKEVYETGRRALQKELAADRRLEEAQRLYNDALQAYQTGLPRAGVSSQKAVSSEEKAKRIEEITSKLIDGDYDQVQTAVTELVEGRDNATPAPDMDQIMHGVGQYLEYEMERRSVVSAFRTPPEQGGYADVVPTELGGQSDSPEVYDFLNWKIAQITQAGAPHSLSTYRKAAEITRKQFGLRDPGRPTLSDKRDKKREIDVVKGVRAKTPVAPKQKEETHEDIIAWHRKQRGLG